MTVTPGRIHYGLPRCYSPGLAGALVAFVAGRRAAAVLAACIMLGVGLAFAVSPGC